MADAPRIAVLPGTSGAAGARSGDAPRLDTLIAVRAQARRGLVERAFLLDAGLTSSAITKRIAAGRLHVVHPGVYAVGHPALMPWARELAALLACGIHSALSHRTAAVLWGLLAALGGPVHVTRQGRRRTLTGVVVHETGELGDVRLREGLRVTSPARTLLDLAAAQSRELDRAVEQALISDLVTPAQLAAELSPRRPGVARLRAALQTEPSLTRSEAERRLLALLRRAGLPRPRTNVRVGRHEVDLLWATERLVVEVDGFAFHSGRAAFERDRLRDADLQLAGYRVFRITWRELAGQPEAVVARIAGALAAP
jgi:very-short-patch-repair endonuclease